MTLLSDETAEVALRVCFADKDTIDMSSPIGHSLAGYLMYCCRVKSMSARQDKALFFSALLAANMPDLDFLPGFLLGHPNLYHHGVSHSLGAALVFSLLMTLAVQLLKSYSMMKNFLFFWAIFCSHLLLDYLSFDARPPAGIPLFWPLSSKYLIFPHPFLPPIHHSHLDNATVAQLVTDFFSLHNLYVVILECGIMLPIGIIIFYMIRKGGGFHEGIR